MRENKSCESRGILKLSDSRLETQMSQCFILSFNKPWKFKMVSLRKISSTQGKARLLILCGPVCHQISCIRHAREMLCFTRPINLDTDLMQNHPHKTHP